MILELFRFYGSIEQKQLKKKGSKMQLDNKQYYDQPTLGKLQEPEAHANLAKFLKEQIKKQAQTEVVSVED